LNDLNQQVVGGAKDGGPQSGWRQRLNGSAHRNDIDLRSPESVNRLIHIANHKP
jgi:hypothetical protein